MKRARESGFFPRAAERFANDDELVAAMLANDAVAWRDFQSKYERLILRCITKVTRRFAWVCAEDVREIAASLFVSLLADDKKKLRAFDPSHGARLSTWIGLLAINAAYDHLRAAAREPPRESLTAAMVLAAADGDPDDFVSERERELFVRVTLDQLTEKDRTLAILYFRERMAPRDIAREMNVSIKTIYSKKHKLLSRLQRAALMP